MGLTQNNRENVRLGLYQGAEGGREKGGKGVASPGDDDVYYILSFQGGRWVLLKIPRCDIDGVGEGK